MIIHDTRDINFFLSKTMNTLGKLSSIALVLSLVACGNVNNRYYGQQNRPGQNPPEMNSSRQGQYGQMPGGQGQYGQYGQGQYGPEQQKQRLEMVLQYFTKHKQLSVNKYAKMTGLSRNAAEDELDAFARDHRSIQSVSKSGRKVYMKR